MAYLTTQVQTLTPRWNWGGTVAYLRIFASQAFFEFETGEYIAQGNPGDINSYCQLIECSVSGTTVTIPEVTLATTTDSTVPTTTYTAILYDHLNVPRYTLLSQFFVDPEYHFSYIVSNLLVSGAGSTAVNITWTHRDYVNGRPQWNIYNEPDSTTNWSVFWTGSEWHMTDATGGVLYKITTNTEEPWNGVWELGTGIYAPPTVEEGNRVVAGTWEQLILSNQGSTPWAQPLNAYWTIPQVREWTLRVQQPIAWASSIVGGKTYLSVDPVLSTHPCAIACNDPLILAWRRFKWLSYDYDGDYEAAVADIGATPTTLFIDVVSDLIDNDLTPPKTLLHVWVLGGQLDINTGKTVTIGLMQPYPPNDPPIRTGPGRLLIARDAVPEMWMEWWTGIPDPDADYTAEGQMAMDSLELQGESEGGGHLKFGAGQWRFDELTIPNYSILTGVGNDPNAGSGAPNTNNGTVIKIFSPTGADYVFRLNDLYHFVVIEHLTISTWGAPAAKSLLWDSLTSSSFHFRATKVSFQSDPLLTAHNVVFDGHGSTETIGNVFDNCWFQVGESANDYSDPHAGIYFDTANASFSFVGTTTFQVNKGSDAIACYRRPFMTFDNLDARGINPSPQVYSATTQRTISSASVSTSIAPANVLSRITLDPATPTNKLFTENDLGQRVFFPSGWTGPGNDSYIFQLISPYEAYLSFHPLVPVVAQSCQVQRWDPLAGKAHAVFNCVGESRSLVVNNGQDEGFAWTGIWSGNLDFPDSFNNYRGQARMEFIGNANLTCSGTSWPGLAFQDNSNGPLVSVVFKNNCYFAPQTTYGPDGTVQVYQSAPWGNQAMIGDFPVTRRPFEQLLLQTFQDDLINFTYDVNNQESRYNNTQICTNLVPDDTKIPFAIGDVINRNGALSDPQQPLLRIGLWDRLSKAFLFYFDQYRHAFSGDYMFKGNQDEDNKRYNFDANLTFKTTEPSVYEANISANYDWYQVSQHYNTFRFNVTGDRAIGGLLVNVNGHSARDNEKFEIVNTGTGTLTLLNQYSATGPPPFVSRFQTDTNANIILYPNESVNGEFDATLQRQRVYAYKSVNQLTGYSVRMLNPVTYNNTTTLTATPLSVTVAVPGYYRIEAHIINTSAVKGLRLDCSTTASIPGGQFVVRYLCTKYDDITTFTQSRSTVPSGTFISTVNATADYTIDGSAIFDTAGTFTIRAAQAVADASNTSIDQGSYLILTKLS